MITSPWWCAVLHQVVPQLVLRRPLWVIRLIHVRRVSKASSSIRILSSSSSQTFILSILLSSSSSALTSPARWDHFRRRRLPWQWRHFRRGCILPHLPALPVPCNRLQWASPRRSCRVVPRILWYHKDPRSARSHCCIKAFHKDPTSLPTLCHLPGALWSIAWLCMVTMVWRYRWLCPHKDPWPLAPTSPEVLPEVALTVPFIRPLWQLTPCHNIRQCTTTFPNSHVFEKGTLAHWRMGTDTFITCLSLISGTYNGVISWCWYQYPWNWSNSQIPQCTYSISHNATFRTEMCTFVFWMFWMNSQIKLNLRIGVNVKWHSAMELKYISPNQTKSNIRCWSNPNFRQKAMTVFCGCQNRVSCRGVVYEG